MAPSSQYSARGFYLKTETGGNAEATPINESSRTQYKKNKYNIDCEKCSIVTTRKDINRLIEDLERRTHGWFDVQNFDVLPILLQKGNQEIDGKLHVKGDIVVVHGYIGDAQRHAHNLLHLELDSCYNW